LKKKPYKLIFTLFTRILIFLFIRYQYQNEARGTVISKIDKFVLTSYKNGKFSGSVLVANNGEIVFEKGYGIMTNHLYNAILAIFNSFYNINELK